MKQRRISGYMLGQQKQVWRQPEPSSWPGTPAVVSDGRTGCDSPSHAALNRQPNTYRRVSTEMEKEISMLIRTVSTLIFASRSSLSELKMWWIVQILRPSRRSNWGHHIGYQCPVRGYRRSRFNCWLKKRWISVLLDGVCTCL